LQINLVKDEESIFSCFKKNTKYEIIRAKNKDGIIIKTLDKTEREKFFTFYDEFAATKHLRPLGRRETNLLLDNDKFVIRTALYNDEPIVYHSYITANGRARLTQSSSLFRAVEDAAFVNLIGRANRLLHWEDMRYFKQLGFSIYDLGGVSVDTTNAETQAVNRFKESFGGAPATEYNMLIPVSLKGWLYVAYRKLRGKPNFW
jgi:hypothetical protein